MFIFVFFFVFSLGEGSKSDTTNRRASKLAAIITIPHGRQPARDLKGGRNPDRADHRTHNTDGARQNCGKNSMFTL